MVGFSPKKNVFSSVVLSNSPFNNYLLNSFYIQDCVIHEGYEEIRENYKYFEAAPESALQGLRGKKSHVIGLHGWTRSRQAAKRGVPGDQRTVGRGRPRKRFRVKPQVPSCGKKKSVACS